MLTFALALALANSPASPPCPKSWRAPDEASIGKAVKEALGQDVKVGECDCYGFDEACPRRDYRLAKYALPTRAAVTFHVEPMASIEDGRLRLAPLGSAAEAELVAGLIRKHPMTVALFQKAPLKCHVSGSTGYAAYLVCAAPEKKTRDDRIGDELSSSGYALRFFFSAAEKHEGEPQRFGLQAWSWPAAQVPASAPGWKEASALDEVKAFLKANPTATADFYNWHKYFLVLWVKGADPKWPYDGPPTQGPGVVVRFNSQQAWYAVEPGPVRDVVTDLSGRFKP
jgi:hypothetical protein